MFSVNVSMGKRNNYNDLCSKEATPLKRIHRDHHHSFKLNIYDHQGSSSLLGQLAANMQNWGGIHKTSYLTLSPNFRIFVIKLSKESFPSELVFTKHPSPIFVSTFVIN